MKFWSSLMIGVLSFVPDFLVRGENVVGIRTPPTSLVMSTNPVTVEDATYSFIVSLSEYKVVRGIPQLKVTTTVTKIAPGNTTYFKDIVIYVPCDLSSVRLMADGRQFYIEASYRDPFDQAIEPRQISTTFGTMFHGGKIGLVAKLLD